MPARSKATATEGAAAASDPTALRPPQPSPIIQALRKDVRWAQISQFLQTFGKGIGLTLNHDYETHVERFEKELDKFAPYVIASHEIKAALLAQKGATTQNDSSQPTKNGESSTSSRNRTNKTPIVPPSQLVLPPYPDANYSIAAHLEPDKHLPDTLLKLLYALTYDRKITRGSMERKLREQYMTRAPRRNVFGGGKEIKGDAKDWESLRVEEKVQVLFDMCEWQMSEPARFRSLLQAEDQADEWRTEPIGTDKEGNTYWLFDDYRLWVQHPPPPEPKKPKPKPEPKKAETGKGKGKGKGNAQNAKAQVKPIDPRKSATASRSTREKPTKPARPIASQPAPESARRSTRNSRAAEIDMPATPQRSTRSTRQLMEQSGRSQATGSRSTRKRPWDELESEQATVTDLHESPSRRTRSHDPRSTPAKPSPYASRADKRQRTGARSSRRLRGETESEAEEVIEPAPATGNRRSSRARLPDSRTVPNGLDGKSGSDSELSELSSDDDEHGIPEDVPEVLPDNSSHIPEQPSEMLKMSDYEDAAFVRSRSQTAPGSPSTEGAENGRINGRNNDHSELEGDRQKAAPEVPEAERSAQESEKDNRPEEPDMQDEAKSMTDGDMASDSKPLLPNQSAEHELETNGLSTPGNQIAHANGDIEMVETPPLKTEEPKASASIATEKAASLKPETANEEEIQPQEEEAEEEEDETDFIVNWKDPVSVAIWKTRNPTFLEWELLCATRWEWEQFPLKFKQSREAKDKSLYKTLMEDICPDVLEWYKEKEIQAAKDEAIANRKRSSRILMKEMEREEQAKAEAARQELEERMQLARADEARRAREEAERLAKEREREDRLKEREERIRHRAEMLQQKEAEEARAKEEAELAREARVKKREMLAAGLLPSRSGSPQSESSPNGAASDGENDSEEDWELACEICKKAGWNLEEDEPLACCERCNRWQHIACHDRMDAQMGKRRRDWANTDFYCRDCRRQMARERGERISASPKAILRENKTDHSSGSGSAQPGADQSEKPPQSSPKIHLRFSRPLIHATNGVPLGTASMDGTIGNSSTPSHLNGLSPHNSVSIHADGDQLTSSIQPQSHAEGASHRDLPRQVPQELREKQPLLSSAAQSQQPNTVLPAVQETPNLVAVAQQSLPGQNSISTQEPSGQTHSESFQSQIPLTIAAPANAAPVQPS